MTTTIRNHTNRTGGAKRAEHACYSLKCEAELEELDREADHDYVPMDVFVGARTIEEHFQMSSIRARWTKLHPGAA